MNNLESFYREQMTKRPHAIVGPFYQAVLSVPDRWEGNRPYIPSSLREIIPEIPEVAIHAFTCAVLALADYYSKPNPNPQDPEVAARWDAAVAANREFIGVLNNNLKTYLEICGRMLETSGWLHFARNQPTIAAGPPFLLEVEPTTPATIATSTDQ